MQNAGEFKVLEKGAGQREIHDHHDGLIAGYVPGPRTHQVVNGIHPNERKRERREKEIQEVYPGHAVADLCGQPLP